MDHSKSIWVTPENATEKIQVKVEAREAVVKELEDFCNNIMGDDITMTQDEGAPDDDSATDPKPKKKARRSLNLS